MLTATYSLVAIAAEQDKTRAMLSRLQQYLQTAWKGLQGIDFSFLENAFGKLVQFDKFFRQRKLELYLIPSLRSVGREADALIAELDALSAKGLGILRSVREQLAQAFAMSSIKVNEICHAMESYCDCMFARLQKEERELIPLARRVFSIEDWFTIAAQFLSDDDESSTRRADAARPRVSADRQTVTTR